MVIPLMGKNERGQVGVVVAILMVSLFVAVIVLVQVYYVPNWMKDREAEHMDTVANQFSQIKASIDIETMAQRDMSLINSITLGSKELPFFVSARAFGSLNILSTSNSEFAVSIEGTGRPSTSILDIQRTDPSDNISYARSLSSFDLRLDMANVNSGDYWFNATAKDTTLSVLVTDTSGYWQIELTVSNASGTVYDQPITWIPNSFNTGVYSINLLNDDYKFSTLVLPYLSTPFNMTFNCSDATAGAFTLSGSQYNGSMGTKKIPMGTIEYASENAYFVDQTYVYEGGAVILNQSQGQSVISAPSFSLQNVTADSGYMHLVSLGMVDITGLAGKTSVSGYGTYSIKTNYSSMDENEYIASTIYINITTSHAAAWQRYMNSTLSRSGIDPDSFNVSTTGNMVAVELYGPSGPSANGDYDVKLSTMHTNIMAQVGPGWVS